MATTTTSVIASARLRVGDTDSSNYFVSDAIFAEIVNSAKRILKKYCLKQGEATVSAVDNTSSYTIPAAVLAGIRTGIFARNNDDVATDRELKDYRINNGTIYVTGLTSGDKIVFWYKTPYVLDTDTLTDDALEILLMLCEIGFIRHALHRRADFEQWAALQKNDASVNQLVLIYDQIKETLNDISPALGDGSDVVGLANY